MSKLLTPEQDLFLRDNAKGRSSIDLLKLVNEEYGLSLKFTQIRAYKKNHNISSGLTGHFTKGHIPCNKGKKLDKGSNITSFKKGHIPHNYRPVGSERITRNGYLEVKIKDPKTWRPKHVLIWEQANGKIPVGHAVIFLDRNRLNMTLDNLALISKSELLRLNQNNLLFDNRDLSEVGVGLAKIMDKIGKRKKFLKERQQP